MACAGLHLGINSLKPSFPPLLPRHSSPLRQTGMVTGQFWSFSTLGWTLEQARKRKAEVAAANTSDGVPSRSTQGKVLPSRQAAY